MLLSSLVWCLPRSTRPSSPGYAPWHLDDTSGIIHFQRWTWLDGTSIMSIKRVAKLMQFGHQDPGWNVPLCKSIIASSVLRRKNLTQDQVSIHIYTPVRLETVTRCRTLRSLQIAVKCTPHWTTWSHWVVGSVAHKLPESVFKSSNWSFRSLSFQRGNVMPTCAEQISAY